MVNKKICPKCRIIKNITDFWRNKTEKDGLQNYCILCRKEITQLYNKNHKEIIAFNSRKIRANLKVEVLSHYSKNGYPQCNNCGISDIDVLCIDHINNDGNIERKGDNSKWGGANMHRRLKAKNFPIGYQTLCANCNLKKELKKRVS